MLAKHYIEDIFKGKCTKDQEVTLKGWVYNKRSSGKVKFLLVRDGTGTMQGVLFSGSTPPEAFQTFEDLQQECSIEVTGTVNEAPKSPGGWEIQVKSLTLIGDSKDYPITPKEHGAAYLLDHRHVWIRSKRQHAILRIRHEVLRASREFFDQQGFISFDSPIFTPNACEGTTDLFEINYFDDAKAYLSQSGQLYGEAGALAHGKVYVLGPAFRAEKSKTRRHLTEFWMLEPEVAFMDINENMELAEGLINHIVDAVLKNRKPELAALDRDPAVLEAIKGPFPKMSYDEASEILLKESKDGFQRGGSFGGGDETILASKSEKPLFVYGFPMVQKPFYTKEDPERKGYSLSCDLLAPEGYGEIIGGAQREDDVDVLQQKIKEHNLDPNVFEWFSDLRRYGTVPHSGFGMGIERTTAWMCGVPHVRECIPFPRMLNRIKP